MEQDLPLLSQLAHADAARARERGLQGRTRVRPAGLGFSRCLRIAEATWIEDGDASDHSGDSVLRGRTTDITTVFKNRRIALKFPQQITARGPFFIVAKADASTVVKLWEPDLSDTDVKARGEASGRPILNWNGLTPSSLRWSNQGALDLSASIGAPLMSLCFADLNAVSVGGGFGTLGSGIADSVPNRQPNTMMLAFDCGTGVTLQGLLLEILLWIQNVSYGLGGYVQTELQINRGGNSESQWSLAALYNPL